MREQDSTKNEPLEYNYFNWLRGLSFPVLVSSMVGFTIMTMLFFSPIDSLLYSPYASNISEGLSTFLTNTLDRVSGQLVCLPILLLVAFSAAYYSKSIAPLRIALLAELGFLSVGAWKILLARNAPILGMPDFYDGGIIEHARWGMSYPSGHATEAVLIYGAAVYILLKHTSWALRLKSALYKTWLLIILNTVTVSFFLGYHWMTDLVAGCLYGLIILKLIVFCEEKNVANLLKLNLMKRLQVDSLLKQIS